MPESTVKEDYCTGLQGGSLRTLYYSVAKAHSFQFLVFLRVVREEKVKGKS